MIEMAAIDRVGVNRFFALISWRYEPGPMVLTSNQSFGAWGEVFGDRVVESRKNGAEDTFRLRLSAARDTVDLAVRGWRRGLAHWFQPRAPTSAQAWGRPWVPI